MNHIFPKREEIIQSKLSELDLDKIDFSKMSEEHFKPKTDIIENQKIYFWIRIYLKDEIEISPDTKVKIKYVPEEEELETIFVCYSKKKGNHNFNKLEEIVEYETEDDKKVLCLMVDSDRINKNSEDIPFIRTLFKISRWYYPQVFKLSDLEISSNGTLLNYYDIEF